MRVKDIVYKRILCMPDEILGEIIQSLNMYGIPMLDNGGRFRFEQLREDCIMTLKRLEESEKPDPETGIRYQLCFLMATIQRLVGIRMFLPFIYALGGSPVKVNEKERLVIKEVT